jgi:hypothetical protein
VFGISAVHEAYITMAAKKLPLPITSADVTVYARHLRECENIAGRKLKKCRCPKWLYIKATKGRISARTMSWEAAEIAAQKIRDSFNPDKVRIAELEGKLERSAQSEDRRVTTATMAAILVRGRTDKAIDDSVEFAKRILARIDKRINEKPTDNKASKGHQSTLGYRLP